MSRRIPCKHFQIIENLTEVCDLGLDLNCAVCDKYEAEGGAVAA